MWISKIELINFKSYRHQIFSFPEPSQGKNIVLIGGMNGFGKTSILESIYLCLYGKDAMAHLARAGLNIDDARGYPSFLEKAFNGEAARSNQDNMSVTITISYDKNLAIEISRRWYFRSSGDWEEEEALVRDIKRGIPMNPRNDGKNGYLLSDTLTNAFVPAHIAPFFFFDGEEVKKLADQSRVEQVKQGLEGLLGVVLLRQLAQRLRTFEQQKRGDITSIDLEKLTKLAAELEDNRSQHEEITSELESIQQKQIDIREKRHLLIDRITTAGGGAGDIANVKQLVEEREQFRNILSALRRKLDELLAGLLPLHLVSKELRSTYQAQLTREIARINWESNRDSLQPRRQQFEDAFFSLATPEFRPPLTDEQSDAIKLRITNAWQSLFSPPPQDCAEYILHTYLPDDLRKNAISYFDTISLGQQDMADSTCKCNTLKVE